MSTRATIAVRRADQTYAAVYLHFDGYPEYTGEILEQHYTTKEATETLVDGGDLRCLNRASGTPEYFADGGPPAKMPTMEALIDFAKNCGVQFVYVFDDATWSCRAL